LILETGTFIGYSAIKMAEGLKANGFGKLITIEFDPAIFAKAKERIDASGLGDWIEYRNASSLETPIDGTIDLLFSDSHLTIREQEIRRFLPQIDARGLILVHDASSHFKVVREAALRLEQEGLISVVLLSTPRGLVIAQKRAGRDACVLDGTALRLGAWHHPSMSSNKTPKQSSKPVLAGVRERISDSHAVEPTPIATQALPTATANEAATKWR
jgi:hypothetical protein